MFKVILSLFLAFFSLATYAGPQSVALGTCLADNTTGKERKELARWVFIAMSAHPDIHKLSNVSDQARDEANQGMAALVTRLLAENCAPQAKSALQSEGAEGLQSSFTVLGQLAMQELMSNPNVSASITEYAKYLDQQKLNAALMK